MLMEMPKPTAIWAKCRVGAGVSGAGQGTLMLLAAAYTVIGIDLRDADIVADLGRPEGRSGEAAGVLDQSGGRLDGAVFAAGTGSSPGPGRPWLIAQINHLGTVEPSYCALPKLCRSDK
ncbi:hypothetical protein ABZ370_36355 [Streptomyces sp. NPDC005962]|uniref:hypothetical protein n=1 Tax=Streptomyces sp. NPDC005962 TaxID=3154466 RepID=UPI0033F41A01